MSTTRSVSNFTSMSVLAVALVMMTPAVSMAQDDAASKAEKTEAADESSVTVEGEGDVEVAKPTKLDAYPEDDGEETGADDGDDDGDEADDDAEADDDGEPKKKGFVHIEVPGSFQLRFIGLADMMVSGIESWDDPDTPDDEILYGNKNYLGQNFYAASRLRISPMLNWKDIIIIRAQFDLLTGPWVGDTTEGVNAADENRGALYAYQLAGQRFRQLYMQINAPFGMFRIGQMASMWGTGMMAASGETEPVFGYYDGGDLVERIMFATKPFQPTGIEALQDLALVIAGDLVYDDNLAEMKTCKNGKKLEYCGDLAFQFILAARWEYRKQALGFYFVYRNQTTEDDLKLEIMAFDGYAHGEVAFPKDITAYAEGEVAYITNKLPGLDKATLAHSVSQLDGHHIEQFGAAGRIGMKWREIIDFWIELGYASGDNNTMDDTLRSYKMDGSHKVGMLLFPEVLAFQSARAASLAKHPNMAGEPVPGVDMLASDGGVFGSFYFNPVLRVKPIKYLDGAIGVVIARASSEMVSPFSQKAGGAPLNYLGGPVSNKDLGVELDLALNFRYPVKAVGIGAGVHFGYLWPGRYFTDYSGSRMGDVWMVMGRVALDW